MPRLLALADGMGGHAAGEVASQLVIAALAHLDDDEPGGDLLSKLDDAVHQGNAAIAAHVDAEPELEGMGTTLTAILFAGNRLGLVHIGDSRGYLLRDGELTQITKDDTFVQTLVDEGRITAEEAHSHPQRSLIMRALTGHEVEPTLIMREARAGDRYLLCSDGLSDPVSQETILEALQIEDVNESADRLIELALRGGGPDNVTVVVADVVDYDYGQTQPILAGAVSGEDDDSAPPEHRRRPRVGDQPAADDRETRCAATGDAGQEAPLPATDVDRRRADRCCWCWPAWRSAARSSAITTTSPSTTARCRSCAVSQGSLLGIRMQNRTCWAASTTATSYPRSATASLQPRLPADAVAGPAALRARAGRRGTARRLTRRRDRATARTGPHVAAAAVPVGRRRHPHHVADGTHHHPRTGTGYPGQAHPGTRDHPRSSPAVADGHRTAATTAETGDRLPGGS